MIDNDMLTILLLINVALCFLCTIVFTDNLRLRDKVEELKMFSRWY